jgi:hypothetical protein
MTEREFSISQREFRGHVLWEQEYPGGTGFPSIRLLIVKVANDSPVIDRHMQARGRDWIVSPGGYVVVASESGRSTPVFSWAYETQAELLEGKDARTHPAFAHVRTALEDALSHLFPPLE